MYAFEWSRTCSFCEKKYAIFNDTPGEKLQEQLNIKSRKKGILAASDYCLRDQVKLNNSIWL